MEIIRGNQAITKPDIAKHAKLSLPTVNKIITSLIEENILCETGLNMEGIGRRAQLYKINSQFGYIVVIYIQSKQITGVLNDFDANVIFNHAIPLAGVDTQSVISCIDEVFCAAKAACPFPDKIKMLCVSVPGAVHANGEISNIPQIAGLEDINLKSILRQKYELPIYIENDVNLITLGTFIIQSMSCKASIIYLYFGDGIGSGIIIGDKIYKGLDSVSGEVGNMLIITDGGPQSLETVIKEKLADLQREYGFATLRELGGMIDNVAHDRLIPLLNSITCAVYNTVCLFNPDLILLQGDYFTPKFADKIQSGVELKMNTELKVHTRISFLYENHNIKGAVYACLQEYFTKHLFPGG
jgi:predicted NBD/HSP70 family sugar kinase